MAKKRRKYSRRGHKGSRTRILRTLLWFCLSVLAISGGWYAWQTYGAGVKHVFADNGYYENLQRLSLAPSMVIEDKQYKGYKVYYNSELKVPNCVVYELIRGEVDGDVPRYKNFDPDPNFVSSADPRDYTRSGYDRGHMAPAADMKWDSGAMRETFYMTNICPQNQNLNRGAWHKLEGKVREWATRDSVLIVACGPIFDTSNPKRIGDGRVAVPSSFFKVILSPHGERMRGIGFIYPNKDCKNKMEEYAVSIDSVEELTGYDFFYELPDDAEAQVESQCNLQEWNRR